MELNDFRVVTSSSVYRKGSAASGALVSSSSTGGQHSNRYRYTLGEVLSTNITLDVNVGDGWTRIRLKEVPKFIVHAFNMITKFGMEVDGIFRKEGNSARLNRAEVQTIYKGQCDIPNDYTVIDVCTLVKRFLRDLKPPLLDSDEFRQRLFKKACQSRISNCFVLTRKEMADMCYYSEEGSKEQQTPLLSDIHFSTLGYVMRQLSRISAHSDQHKMSVDNLSVVLVGSVFGDGIHNPKKGGAGQIRRGSQDDILAQKKQDMNVHVAAVKLLITNVSCGHENLSDGHAPFLGRDHVVSQR
uniref:Rho-GAP domain-containing protein n=1 Tax=Caenorhabditis japonica TaxID=281687 RepID=A0A8R1EAE8_CAEJA